MTSTPTGQLDAHDVRSCTCATSRRTLSSGVCGRIPCPRLKTWPGRPPARSRTSSARARSSRHGASSELGIEIALHGPVEADGRPRLVQRKLPVEADDISSAGGRIREIRAHAEREVDHRHVCVLESCEELSVRGSDRAQVVLASERPPGPGVEHLQRLGAGAGLSEEVVRLDGDEPRQEPPPGGGLGEHERLRLRKVLRGAALDRVARERERRPREPDDRDAARLELAAHDGDRLERAGHRLLRGRRRQHVDVARARDRVGDLRPVALHEVEVEAHADERREDVREHDRRVDAERLHRLERHLRRELGRPDQLEHRVPLPQCPVLRHVAARLAQEPDRRALGRQAAIGAEDERARLGVGRRRRCLGQRGALCHATRPTKNGPRRSRWSDV